MNTTTIQKWGNSYAVRILKIAMRKLNLLASNSVEIREMMRGRTLSIVPVRRRSTSLAEMVSRITNKNQHSAVDWGNAVGNEVW